MNMDDGGIKRCDRRDTGDERAQPTEGASEKGSGTWGGADAGPTGRPTGTSEAWDPTDSPSTGTAEPGYDRFDTLEDQPSATDLDDMTVMDAEDPSLGLTNIGGKPAEDWAANTGPTRSNEEMEQEI